MKRTRSYFKSTIPGKKIKRDGTWEELQISRRIFDLCKELIKLHENDPEEFLQFVTDEEKITKDELTQVAQFRATENQVMLHFVCTHGPKHDPALWTNIIRVLVEACNHAVLAADNRGKVPLHRAFSAGAPSEAIEILIKADGVDPSTSNRPSSLLAKDRNGELALHYATFHALRSRKKTSRATIQLYLDNPRKKEILLLKNNQGETALHVACIMDDRIAFPFLAEECIQTLVARRSWQDRLRKLVQTYETKLDLCEQNFFMNLFNETVAGFEKMDQEIIPLLERVVWQKLTSSGATRGQRKERWITCGATSIVDGVAEYLGDDPLTALQAECDRNETQHESSRSRADDNYGTSMTQHYFDLISARMGFE